jgi:hypothetical protein
MAVNRFDGHIQIRNPRLFQRGGIRALQRLRLPGSDLGSVLILKSAAQAGGGFGETLEQLARAHRADAFNEI